MSKNKKKKIHFRHTWFSPPAFLTAFLHPWKQMKIMVLIWCVIFRNPASPARLPLFAGNVSLGRDFSSRPFAHRASPASSPAVASAAFEGDLVFHEESFGLSHKRVDKRDKITLTFSFFFAQSKRGRVREVNPSPHIGWQPWKDNVCLIFFENCGRTFCSKSHVCNFKTDLRILQVHFSDSIKQQIWIKSFIFMSYELFVGFLISPTSKLEGWRQFFFFPPQSGGVASSVALVLWDLTLLLSAMRNTTRQAINLRGKRRRRFRNTWKQPTGVERMDFRSPRPFSPPWMGVGGRKTEERNLKKKKKSGILYFVAPFFLPCVSWFYFIFFHMPGCYGRTLTC